MAADIEYLAPQYGLQYQVSMHKSFLTRTYTATVTGDEVNVSMILNHIYDYNEAYKSI